MYIDDRLLQARVLYEDLKSCHLYEFGSIKPSMIPKETPGVYAIYQKDTMETLYVGKSTNLRRRIYQDHLMGNLANARLKKYLIEDNESFPHIKDLSDAKQWLKDKCCFQFIKEQDYRERGHIEGLMSFVLNTKYVDIEH